MLQQRSSGLLLHVTSLPSAHGVGDLGPEAYRFADFLASAGQTYWQILPLTPVDPGAGFSPYSSPSAFAGNPLLISLDKLVDNGLLSAADCRAAEQPATGRVDYPTTWQRKLPLLTQAADTFRREQTQPQYGDYERFCVQHAHWLDDYALFRALQDELNEPAWVRWPAALRQRKPADLNRYTEQLHDRIETLKVLQFLFYRQWTELVGYCFARRVHLVGDIPIYVQHNSADVWTHQHLFKLDKKGEPRFVAGAPPDYFSEDGQRWGNPVYDWPKHEAEGFAWWIRRLKHQLSMYSLTRLDHFLGFAVYWEIPASEPTAKVGRWVDAPIDAFLHAMYRQFVQLPLIAEDLGARTPDVQPSLRHYGIPGMRLVQFGIGDDIATSNHIPHNYVENAVAYTGTHDNNTTRGWFTQDLDDDRRQRLREYLGFDVTEADVAGQLVRLVMQSVARLVIVPVQDVLNLGAEHRMNTPGVGNDNWTWRVDQDALTPDVAAQLRAIGRLTGRTD